MSKSLTGAPPDTAVSGGYGAPVNPAATTIAYLTVVACTGAGATYLGVASHEGAHALVALLMGLRVKSIKISLRGGKVTVDPKGRALPARMIAMTLAGPVANLAFAWVAWWAAVRLLASRDELGPFVLGVAGVIAIMGVANLIPVRATRTGGTDGFKILLWAFRPRVTTAGASSDPAQLARIIATTTDPLVLLAAVKRRIGIDPKGYTEFIADADRLLAIARDERTRRAAAAAIAQWLSLHFGFAYLHMTIAEGAPVGRADREEIVETAELAVRLNPQGKPSRIGLAVARLLDGRPAEARDLLTGFRTATKGQHAVVVRLFAVAEIYLGNGGRAEELLASVTQPIDAQLRDVLAKLRNATELPPLVQPEPTPAAVPEAAHQGSSN
jgi:hypothetical protein